MGGRTVQSPGLPVREAGRRRCGRRRVLPLLLAGLVTVGCLADPFTGATVVVDFVSDLAPSSAVRLPDGSDTHYELWVQFEQLGVLSVGKFVVSSDSHILSYPDVENRIGSVTGADDLRRSGVRFVSQANLRSATSAFVTLERNGETDIAPSPSVIMEGALTRERDGELRGVMEGEYRDRLNNLRRPEAWVTIIIAEDNAFF
jgi:hypothetical protein